MQTIETMASIEGRRLLHSIFRELRFERQLSAFRILFTTWKICTSELNTGDFSNKDITILHKIGIFKGTSIWMEEIVNRFFFSSVLSLVYFGAAFLILVIGLNRFTDYVPLFLLIAAVVFESTMLMVMFLTMLFSPKDDSYYTEEGNNDVSSKDEILIEIGEIGRDLASVVVQLENLHDTFKGIIAVQTDMVESLKEANRINMDLAKPNPELIDHLKKTNQELEQFKNTFGEINQSISQIKDQKIDEKVKEQIAKIIKNNI